MRLAKTTFHPHNLKLKKKKEVTLYSPSPSLSPFPSRFLTHALPPTPTSAPLHSSPTSMFLSLSHVVVHPPPPFLRSLALPLSSSTSDSFCSPTHKHTLTYHSLYVHRYLLLLLFLLPTLPDFTSLLLSCYSFAFFLPSLPLPTPLICLKLPTPTILPFAPVSYLCHHYPHYSVSTYKPSFTLTLPPWPSSSISTSLITSFVVKVQREGKGLLLMKVPHGK